MSHYKVLGVEKTADKATIKKAYRRKAKDTHPDRGGDADQFKALTRAYDILSDDERRAHYDRTGDDARNFQGIGGVASVLEGVFANVVSNLGSIPIECVDLVEKMRINIKSSIDNGEMQIAGMRKELRKWEQALRRFKKKKDDGIMSLIIQTRIDSCNGMISNLEDQTEACKAAYSYLKDCSYEYDESASFRYQEQRRRGGLLTLSESLAAGVNGVRFRME